VKFILAVEYARFSGHRGAVIVLNRLINAGIIGAIGIAKEINCALECLLQAATALTQLEINFRGRESSEDRMRQSMRAQRDQPGIECEQEVPIHKVVSIALGGRGAKIRSRGTYDFFHSLTLWPLE